MSHLRISLLLGASLLFGSTSIAAFAATSPSVPYDQGTTNGCGKFQRSAPQTQTTTVPISQLPQVTIEVSDAQLKQIADAQSQAATAPQPRAKPPTNDNVNQVGSADCGGQITGGSAAASRNGSGGATSGSAANYHGNGTVNDRIYQAMLKFIGTNTSAMFGAAGDYGRVACMFSVNAILNNALGHYLANNTGYVPAGVAALRSGAGTNISQSQAMPGTLVVSDDQGHIGVCINVGCTLVYSNSSSHACFCWGPDGPDFRPSYNGPSTFWNMNS